MQGKIVKGIAGFYYVHVNGIGVIECKAKGIFRKDGTKPLVGDNVEIETVGEEHASGNIVLIHKRNNEIIRPAVANIDQAVIIFSMIKPMPNLNLLDRFLIMMEKQHIPCIICFNKEDIVSREEQKKLQTVYQNSGYLVLVVSAKRKAGIERLKAELIGKTTVVAGPSGVGKSSIINCLQSEITMETGEISVKIERGKHTTRHSQLIDIFDDTYIMDTPGFSSLLLDDIEKEELGKYYPEFVQYEGQCKFQGCSHIHEPVCGIRQAVEQGDISKERFDNYKQLYQELSEKRRY